MHNFIEAQKFVWQEFKENKHIIIPFAISSIIKKNIESTLGQWWMLIRDILYYFAFSFIMIVMVGNRGAEVDGMDKLVYMTCGMVPFFIFSDIMNTGIMSIRKNKGIITKIKFPVVLIPIIESLAILLGRTLSVIGMLMIVYFFEQFANVEWISLLYYMICMVVFSTSLNMVVSGLGAISKDFREVVLSIMRVFIYFVPIMWSIGMVSAYPLIELIVKLNPMVYIMEGVRSGLSTGTGNTFGYTVYFWVITLLILLVGNYLQFKLRKIYPDVI